jgi:glycosyltransferase involved in cell wall biosynthesis
VKDLGEPRDGARSLRPINRALARFLMAMTVASLETSPRNSTAAALPDDARWAGCVSVIVPAYNEVAHVDELLQAIHASPVKKEIIIVDDGSTDGTREKLRAMPLANNNNNDVTVVFHEKNCGKGAAIRTALQYARGEYILIQDSDLEYDPQDYPALLRPLEQRQANVVYGVRPDRPERGLRFFLGAKLLTHLTNLLYGAGIHDEATCYKVFRRSLIAQIGLECHRFEFCPEVTAKLCRMGEKIAEVPIAYAPRSAGEGKKIRHSDGWLAIWTLLRWRFTRRARWARSGRDAAAAPFAVSFSRVPPNVDP